LEREEQQYKAKLIALAGGHRRRRLQRYRERQRLPACQENPQASPAVALAVAPFRFSRRAEADLLSIGEYTLRTWGKAQAARYIGELEMCCQTMADNPGVRPTL